MPPKKRKNRPKRNFKKQYRKQRRAVVETKRREAQELAIRNSVNGAGAPGTFNASYPDLMGTATAGAFQFSATTAINNLPIQSFLRMSRGKRKNQLEGVQAYVKDIYMKLSVQTHVLSSIAPVYFVCGWIQANPDYNDFSTPTLKNATQTDLNNFIGAHLEQHFDEYQDHLRYREAKKDAIKILKYQRIQTDDTVTPPGDEVHLKMHWKVNRKVTYQEGQRQAGSNELVQNSDVTPGVTITMTEAFKDSGDQLGGDSQNLMPCPRQYLPFAIIYSPQFKSATSQPQYSYNNITYFTG